MIDTGSLETITEEEFLTSKESSPLYLGSPPPSSTVPRAPPTHASPHRVEEKDVLHKVVSESEELQRLLKQIMDTVHETETNMEEDVDGEEEGRRGRAWSLDESLPEVRAIHSIDSIAF